MPLLPKTPFFFSIIVVLFLSGCSNNFENAIESLNAAIEHNKGKSITPEYIDSLPYASAIVTVNEFNPILMVLAFADNPPNNDSYQFTWLAADQGAIVTENGRIIHTSGLPSSNLERLASTQNTPPFIDETTPWSALYDWSPGYRYNFSAQVQSTNHGVESISTDLWTQNADHISETVIFDSLNAKFTNHFWQAAATNDFKKHVIKSVQYIGPNMERIEMTIMKPFLEPVKTIKVTNE